MLTGQDRADVLDAAAALELVAGIARQRYGVPTRRGRRRSLPQHTGVPDPADLDRVREWVREASGLTAVDLFCGAGGLGLGLHQTFRVLVAADSDPIAVGTYAGNMASLPCVEDLSDPRPFLDRIHAWGIDSVDLVAGGVPCQPFSRAGRSKIRSLVAAGSRPDRDLRVDLWRSFIQVVEELTPKAVLLENVPDLAEWDDGAVLMGFLESLRDLGFEPDARILNAYDYGVPQYRARLFIVGLRHGYRFTWPTRTEPRPTLWDAISDLPVVSPGLQDETVSYSGPITDLQRRLRRDMPEGQVAVVSDHFARSVRSDDLEAYELLPEGGTYLDIPEHLRRYRSDIFRDKYKRLRRDDLSRTITAHIARDGYWYIHPTENRTLTIREAARLQTFPDWFIFAGEPSHRFRQIGNAVPPLLAETVGRAVATSLERGVTGNHVRRREVRDRLVAWHTHNSRRYPWRTGGSPWSVLLAEMCLHRTRADQVATVYRRLMELAPTPTDLLAHEDDVRHVLASLGLRWRVDNIVVVAREIDEVFGGDIPESREDLLTLSGVGDYVASAVRCFGFGRSAVLMDTNTERIARRLRGESVEAKRWQTRLDLYGLSSPVGPDREFNYALLDLGSFVCRPSHPRCLVCPLNEACTTFKSGDQN